MRRVAAAVVIGAAMFARLLAAPTLAEELSLDDGECAANSLCADVILPPQPPHPAPPTTRPADPDDVTPTGNGSGGSGGGPGAPAGPPRHPGLTYEECVAFLDFTEDRSACEPAAPAPPATPGAPADPAAPPPTVVLDPGTVAQSMRNTIPVPMPGPHTSPPEGGFQLVGLPTWYWLDADDWRPVSVRAELPGIWVEVTATPRVARWSPGDGGVTVTCSGPARRHPGTAGATTDCGHTYLRVGSFTLTASVEFAVTWEASTGETGTLDPITLSAQLPIEVQQRQAVIDG